MGLDITAYSKLKPYEKEVTEYNEPVDENDWGTVVSIYVNSDFSERCEDVPEGAYDYEEEINFRAGSYGGYNAWRADLAALVGLDPQACWDGTITEGPFYELINFSDCEGTLGTAVCKKLLADFEAHADKLNKNADYFTTKYIEWMQAFKLASDDGCVRFH